MILTLMQPEQVLQQATIKKETDNFHLTEKARKQTTEVLNSRYLNIRIPKDSHISTANQQCRANSGLSSQWHFLYNIL